MPRFAGHVVDRAFEFGVRVLKMACQFPGKPGFYRVLDQITAAGTSVASNLEEAQGAYSRADFFHAVNIARKEARECWVRLRMLSKCGVMAENRFAKLIAEGDAIVAILTRIMKSGSRGAANSQLATRNSQRS
jgi:four helix bundle protein